MAGIGKLSEELQPLIAQVRGEHDGEQRQRAWKGRAGPWAGTVKQQTLLCFIGSVTQRRTSSDCGTLLSLAPPW